MNKYLRLRSDYEKRTGILQKAIAQENKTSQELEAKDTELLEAKNSLNERNGKLVIAEQFIRQMQDHTILNGYWDNSYVFETGEKGIERVFIENGRYYILSELGEKQYKFDIKNFFFDNRNSNVFFVKELMSSEKRTKPNKAEHFCINRLRFESADFMAGTENETTRIGYRKV